MSHDDLFDEQMSYPFPVAQTNGQGTDEVSSESLDRRFPGGGGIYLLTDEQDRVILLSSAADMRRALRHRLLETPVEPSEGQKASRPLSSRRRLKLHEIVRRIRWKRAGSLFELNYEYQRIAREIIPEDYLENLAFGPAWFVHVDPMSAIPRFSVSKWLTDAAGSDLGPFPTQTAANRFVQVLQDLFDLCRYEHILEKTPNGQACAYFEMGRCPAPCDGSLPIERYREMVSAAWAFAGGRRPEVLNDWQTRMATAAARQAFEEAAHFKQLLQRARELEHESYRFVRPVRDFNYLVVQRVGARRQVKPFFVREGWIVPGEAVVLKNLDRAAVDWRDAMALPPPLSVVVADEAARRLRSEHIWLVSHFLFKRETPGWFLHKSDFTDSGALAATIRARFNSGHEPATDSDA